MAKNGTAYKKSGGIYHPLTNTHQVLNPDGSRLEERLTDDEQAVKGKGSKASAKEYPFRFIGEYNSIAALNTALDAIFSTTDEKYQGSLRARLNGQTVFIQQIGIFISRGDWAQVVLGLVAPSQDGTLLTTSGTPNVLWRSRDTGNSTVVSHNWQTIASVNLKTVNGQSLIGEGDISVSGSGGTITVDSDLDPTSTNPVQNKKVYAAIYALQQAISALPDSSAEGGVIVCKQWAELFIAGNEGDYAYNTSRKTIHKYTSGSWVEQESHPQAGVIYINALAHSSYYWNGTDMVSLLGDAPLSAINMNSSSPVNSKAVADYVEGEKKVVNCQHWGSSLPASSADGNYGYDTTNNVIKRYSDSASSWESLGEPREDVLYKNPNDGHLYHYEEDLMKMVIDSTDIVDEIPSSGGSSSIPTAAAVREYVTKDTSIPSSNPSETHIPTTKAVKNYVDASVANAGGGGSVNDKEVKGWGEPDFNDPLRPEYWLIRIAETGYTAENKDTIKWGIPFYEWPIRCYNGSGNFSSANGTANVEVFAPSERIVFNALPVGETAPADINTDNVLFDTSNNSFVLFYNGNYYRSWNNSSEWNDPSTGKARTDVLFSDISNKTDDEEIITTSSTRSKRLNPAKRNTYVFGYDGVEEFTDITTLMTDFSLAIYMCLRKNNGSMRLSNKIYFMGDAGTRPSSSPTRTATVTGESAVTLTNKLYQKSNFIIDGGCGVLFTRHITAGYPQTGTGGELSSAVINFERCQNGVVRNMTMRCLRDRDNGCPNGHWRFSSSCSKLQAFSLNEDDEAAIADPDNNSKRCFGMTFENLFLQNFYEDFKMQTYNRNTTINGWKSIGASQNNVRGTNTRIMHADITQHDYVGAGIHVIYGQSNLKGFWASDCVFRQGKYSSELVTFHGGGKWTFPDDIHFERCDFYGSRVLYGSKRDSWIHLHNCTINQTSTLKITNNHYQEDGYSAVCMAWSNWEFTNCRIHLLNQFVETSRAGSNRTIILRDTGITTRYSNLLGSPGTIKLVLERSTVANPYPYNKQSGDSGTDTESEEEEQGTLPTLVTKPWSSNDASLSINSPATIGDINELNDICESNTDTINQLYSEIHGGSEAPTYTVSTLEDRPQTAAEGQTCLVTSTNKVYSCTKAAVKSSCVLYMQILNRPSSSVTKTFTVTITEGETLELSFTYDATTAYKTLYNAFVSSIRNLGYECEATNFANDTNGERCYVRIYSKEYADTGSEDTLLVVKNSNDQTEVKVRYNGSKLNVKKTPYEPPTWDPGTTVESGGLAEDVVALKNAIRIDFPHAGPFASAPDIEEVGDGFFYFDTTNNRPLWASVSAGTGNTPAWVDGTGTAVS